VRRIYLDHAATTPLDPSVAAAMAPWMDCGNPSSQHGEGRRARMAIDEAREQVAEHLRCLPGEVVFTSSGTEAANLAILGTCWAMRGGNRRRVLFGASEHHCVLHTRELLESWGYEVSLIAVERDASVLDKGIPLADDVLLVCVMHANNETGVINDVESIGGLCSEHGALFFSDCVQTNAAPEHCDFRSYSAHKFYGPKGAGALYVKAGNKPQPWLVGGGQERELRAGTENVAAIVGFAAALGLHVDPCSISRIRNLFVEEVSKLLPSAILTAKDDVLPGHAHYRVPGASAEAVLIVLDRLGVSASSGAACSSGSIEPSHVLLAARFSGKEATEGLRFSFGKANTNDDAIVAAQRFADAVAIVTGG